MAALRYLVFKPDERFTKHFKEVKFSTTSCTVMWGGRHKKVVIGPPATEGATKFGGNVIEGMKGQTIMPCSIRVGC